VSVPPEDTVRGFYLAVGSRDASAVSALVERQFHEEASITWPASLPYGGTVRGRSRLRKVLVSGASVAAGPMDLELVALATGGLEVAAEVRFLWREAPGSAAVESGAVEWWRFDEEGLVRSIRAYYADTAALLTPGADHG
jgi:SnoaL-like domain